VKWDMVLGRDQLPNPVIRSKMIDLPETIGRYPQMLETMFPSNNHSLKTWGRTPGVTEMDPHWIGVRKGTPLHTDKAYPRITHQIMVNVDPGFVLRGLNKDEMPLARGLFFVLDTHSPHQLYAPAAGPQWYLALSVDTKQDDVPDGEIVKLLLDYGHRFVFSDADAASASKAGGQRLAGS